MTETTADPTTTITDMPHVDEGENWADVALDAWLVAARAMGLLVEVVTTEVAADGRQVGVVSHHRVVDGERVTEGHYLVEVDGSGVVQARWLDDEGLDEILAGETPETSPWGTPSWTDASH